MVCGKMSGLYCGSGDWYEDIIKFIGEKRVEYFFKVRS